MVTALSIFVIAWIIGQYWFIDYWRSLKKKTISKEIMLAKQQEEDKFNELTSKIENEFVKITAQMAVTKALVDNLNNENNVLKEKNDEKDTKLIEVIAQNEALKAKNSELNDTVGKTRNEVTEAKASNELLNFKNETLEREAKNKDGEIAKLKDTLVEKSTKADSEIAKLKESLAEKSAKADAAEAQANNLSAEFEKEKKEKASIMLKLETATKELKTKEKMNDDELEALRKKIAELEGKLDKAQKKLGIFETVFATVKENINEV